MKKSAALKILPLFVCLLIPSVLHAETPENVPVAGSGQALPEVKTYEALRQAIPKARSESTSRIEKAVDREKVRGAWEIGKLIDAHVLQNKERAAYGEKVLLRLSSDLGMSHTELKYMLQFYRAYPIRPPADQLSWSEYRELLSVNDAKERDALAEKAVNEKWNRDQMREEVKKVKARKGTGSAGEVGVPVPPEEKLLPLPTPGKPGIYRMIEAEVGPASGKVVIDLGFSNYYRTSKDLRFKPGDIIETTPPPAGRGSSPSDRIRLLNVARVPGDVSRLLYTYRAWVKRVLDGDTIEVVVDLGFGVRSVQTLRLRGIDCPELVSKDGKEAKEFVEKMLGTATGVRRTATGEELSRDTVPRTPYAEVFIKTSKSDKYDRYLADVFYEDNTGESQYLNNVLLQKGLAVKVRE